MNKIKHVLTGSLLYLVMVPVASANAIMPKEADVLFVIDESGSMAGEHSWISNMVADLEAGLIAANVGTGSYSNNYGLIGFGAASPGISGHTHSVGGSDWGSATNLSTASSLLETSGSFEDGWEAINYGLNNYSFRMDAAVNIILITDEDRDTYDSSLTYNDLLSALMSKGALLNSVINCGFSDGMGSPNSAIGVSADGTAYIADGSGGFTASTGGQQNGTCAGSTKADYADLAWDTGGAAWDLGHLRAGGSTATSFSNAFIDTKVQEITKEMTSVPEPSTLALMGLGLFSVGFMRRKAK